VPQPWHCYALPDGSRGDPVAELLDDPNTFMAWHKRQCRLHRPVAVDGVDVCVTEAACLQSHEYLSGPGCRDRAILNHEWFMKLIDDGSAHGGSFRLTTSLDSPVTAARAESPVS
jgi:hypothetical protein